MNVPDGRVVVRSKVRTRVDAVPGAEGRTLVLIWHGDSVIEADSEVLRKWLNELRSAVPHAVSLAERGAA